MRCGDAKRALEVPTALSAHLEAGGRLDTSTSSSAGRTRGTAEHRHRPRAATQTNARPARRRPPGRWTITGVAVCPRARCALASTSTIPDASRGCSSSAPSCGKRDSGRGSGNWQLGYLSPGAVTDSLAHRRPDERIGEGALRLYLMSAPQHQVVLLAQASSRRRIGDFFLESKALHPFDLADLGHAFRRHNARVALSVAR